MHYKLMTKAKITISLAVAIQRVLEEQFSQILFQQNLFSLIIMFFKLSILVSWTSLVFHIYFYTSSTAFSSIIHCYTSSLK